MSKEHFLPVADQKKNIIRLSAAQAPGSSLATLPATVFVLGMAACILP